MIDDTFSQRSFGTDDNQFDVIIFYCFSDSIDIGRFYVQINGYKSSAGVARRSEDL